MPNPLVALRQLFAAPPVQIGEVTAVSGVLASITLPGGATITARGTAAVGQHVFVRGGVIEGQAESLSVVTFEV